MFPEPGQRGRNAEDKPYDDECDYVRSEHGRPLRTDGDTDKQDSPFEQT